MLLHHLLLHLALQQQAAEHDVPACLHKQIMKEDDNNWPLPDRVGKQELEIKMNGEHICFNTTKLGSVLQVQQSKDPDGLRIFYYLVQVCVLLM